MHISHAYAKAPPAPRQTIRQAVLQRRSRDSLTMTLALGLFVFAVVFAAASLFV